MARKIWFCAAALLFALAFALQAATQSPSLFVAATVRQALQPQRVAPELTVVPRTARELRWVVSRRLDPRLLAQAQGVTGRDFIYQFAASNRMAQIGTIVLRYPAAAVAKRMAALLEPLRNRFHNSKILIRFSAVPLGNLLVVTYSESSGNAGIAGAIEHLPASFQSASGGVDWIESDSLDATAAPAAR